VSETLAHGRAIPLRDAAKQKGTHGYSRFSRLPITGVDFAAIWAKPTGGEARRSGNTFARAGRLDAGRLKKDRPSHPGCPSPKTLLGQCPLYGHSAARSFSTRALPPRGG
jgi:hypothetical protein